MYSCSGSEDDDDNTTSGIATGTFVTLGVTYTGICVSGQASNCTTGILVTIAHSSGASFIIDNMPQASSGTFTFSDFFTGGNCNLKALNTLTGGIQYASVSGSITKTGAKSFTFSCNAKSTILNSQPITITGNGSY